MILSLSPCSASIFPFFPIFSVFCFPVCFMLYPRSDACRTSKDPYRLSRKSMRHRRGTGAVSAIRVPEPRTISDHLVDFCQNHGDDYLTTLGFLWFLADPKSLHENLCICHILSQSEVGPGNIAYIARLTVNGITVSSRRVRQRLAMKRWMKLHLFDCFDVFCTSRCTKSFKDAEQQRCRAQHRSKYHGTTNHDKS